MVYFVNFFVLVIVSVVEPQARHHIIFPRSLVSWLASRSVQYRTKNSSSCWRMRLTKVWRVWWRFKSVQMTSFSYTTGSYNQSQNQFMSQKFVKTTGNFSKQMDASEKCARSYVMVLSNWDWETHCQVFLFSPSHGNDMGNFLGDPGTRKTIFMIRRPGRSQDFSKGGGGGGHTVSNREYSPDFHVHLYAVFYVMWQKKKGLP